MENYGCQVNLHVGDTLINIRGVDVASVLNQLGEFAAKSQWVSEQLSVVQQATNAVTATAPAYQAPAPAAPPAPQYGPPAQAAAPQYGPPATQQYAAPPQAPPTGQHAPAVNQGSPPPSSQPGTPSCSHGAMKWAEGVNKAGKPYKGYYCTAPRGQSSCSPVYVN